MYLYCKLISGGVGFDINCGVRLLRTNLFEKDVQPVKEKLAQSLFDHIPVGVGSKGNIFTFLLYISSGKIIIELLLFYVVYFKEIVQLYKLVT